MVSAERKEYLRLQYLRNKEKRNLSIRNKRINDINFALRSRLRALFLNALKRYTQEGKISNSDKYGIDYKSIIEHLKPFPEDLSKYHIDHIKPICLFDLTNSEEIKKAFAPENHQWLTIEENLKKGSNYEF